MTFQLSQRQKETARELIASVFPALQPQTGDEPELFALRVSPDRLLANLERTLPRSPTAVQGTFVRLLDHLNSGWRNWLLVGIWAPFSELSAEVRQQVLTKLLLRSGTAERLLLSGLLKLVHYHAYSSLEEFPEQLEQVWKTIGFNPPARGANEFRLPAPARVRSEQTKFAADYLVVGSGAGGSVMAAELAETGKSVLLVDAGPLPRASELGHSEGLANRLWLESHGTLPSLELPLQLLSGRVVGGGTVINWGTYLAPPRELLEHWTHRFGFNACCSEAWQHSHYAVRRRLELNQASEFTPANRLLEAAARQLGWAWQTVDRNQGSCDNCQSCSFGCPGGKQDALQSYLLDAERLGVHLLPNCRIERLESEQGRVESALGRWRDEEGTYREVEFRFRHLILAAGAVHTPALLQRSGLGNSHVGQHLQLHPATIVLGEFDEPMDPWSGPPQAIVCDHFAPDSLTAAGLRIEALSLPPGLLAMTVPWQGAPAHRRTMQRARHLAGWLVLVHDLADRLGSVDLSPSGQPRIRYRLSPEVQAAVSRGISLALQGLRTAGASRLLAPTLGLDDFDCRQGETAFGRYLRAQQTAAGRLGNLRLFSAHQMSTCRLASSTGQGAVDPQGRLYGLKNAFVADASALPTSTGVNPALTITTLSHYLAQQIKQRTA